VGAGLIVPGTGETGAQEARNPVFDIDRVVAELAAARQKWRTAQQRSTEPGGRELPSREALSQVMTGLRGALFPMRLGPPELRQESEDFYVGHTLDAVLHSLLAQVRLELRHAARFQSREEAGVEEAAVEIVRAFSRSLPEIRVLLDSDVTAAFEGDPAARSVDEVLLCYPGILAMIHHRVAHRLYRLGVPLVARIIAELAHSETGIDIHPGATIGAGFFIDHGTGVVIGETAIIGRRVRIYQAVTLGAKRFPADAEGKLQKGLPRHPVVEDDVVIYAGATVLGRVTLGRGATIGGNVWVTYDVAPGSHVTQASSRHERNLNQEEAKPRTSLAQ
jgi:serine O-acetyltransferase